ncbi:MAG: dicarboxylate/amino acid:cation symporter [Acidobacteria bacterium]|nr:dicarboxylate/amino acid:cation symporter [Acidobacteriota bacterium]
MRRLKLHWWILIGMAVGAAIGTLLHGLYPTDIVQTTSLYHAVDGIATIFLNLLKLIVIPLVFFSLITGMLGMGNLAQLGRIGIKTFLLYILTSLLAIFMGLALVNLVRPGIGVHVEVPTEAVETEIPESAWEVITSMVPDNLVKAAAQFDLLGIILFALMFGAFLITLEGEKKKTLVNFVEAVAEVMMKMTGFIISLAPLGIAALIARLVSSTGLGIFWEMRWYVVTVLVALAAHLFLTLPLLILLMTRRNPYRFLRAMSSALLTGFSTASSSGTLPVTMERVEKGAGVSRRITSFVLPLGATINMDGTALYEIFTVLFIAQIHSGIDPSFSLSIGQQLLVAFLGLAVSIGAAGIPHAGLVMMVIILQAVGLPIEYTALIWAIDRPIDMFRTAVNLGSDSTITLIVAHSENQIDESVLFDA